jgi:hypothetical protein
LSIVADIESKPQAVAVTVMAGFRPDRRWLIRNTTSLIHGMRAKDEGGGAVSADHVRRKSYGGWASK